MNYRLQSKQKTNKLSRYGFLFGGIILLYLCVQWLFPGVFSSWLGVLDTKYRLVHNITVWWANKSQLVYENELLRSQLYKQNIQTNLAKVNHEYYAQLDQEMRGTESGSIVSAVLLRPPVAVYDRFILDKGLSDGVTKGSLVTVAGDFVVGYVDYVNENNSRVALFSSAGEEFVVDINGYLYRAEGQGGGSVLVKLSRDLLHQTGQTVRVPGAGGRILGSVVSAEAVAQDSYVTGYTVLAHNLFQSRFVTVVDEQWQNVDESIFDIQDSNDEEENDTE